MHHHIAAGARQPFDHGKTQSVGRAGDQRVLALDHAGDPLPIERSMIRAASFAFGNDSTASTSARRREPSRTSAALASNLATISETAIGFAEEPRLCSSTVSWTDPSFMTILI